MSLLFRHTSHVSCKEPGLEENDKKMYVVVSLHG